MLKYKKKMNFTLTICHLFTDTTSDEEDERATRKRARTNLRETVKGKNFQMSILSSQVS